ncbi:MAG: hypothetical protein R3F33_09515 [Planctomycetota bacterium]
MILRRTAKARAAFTVVELLIAIAIMAMMMVTILKVLTAVRLTRDRIHNTQETQLAGPVIMDLITNDLLGIQTLGRPRTEQIKVQDRVQYGLDADRLDFVTTTPSREPVWVENRILKARICEVGYVTRANPDDDEFLELYRREDFGVDEEPFKGGSYTFLTNRLKSFSIEVYKADGEDEDVLNDWNAGAATGEEFEGLPASIVIRMTLENAPRLLREQIEFRTSQLMTVTYERTIRFNEALRVADEQRVFLGIPASTTTGDSGDGGEGGKDNEGGGGGGGGGSRPGDGTRDGANRSGDGTKPSEGGGRNGRDTDGRTGFRGNTRD